MAAATAEAPRPNQTRRCSWHSDSCGSTSPDSGETSRCPSTCPRWSLSPRQCFSALRTVGYGETITYGELAELSGTGVPARAIGEIMAANPVPIIIPCHRVVASDGLGGYSGGEPGRHLETKRWLLENEGALPPALV